MREAGQRFRRKGGGDQRGSLEKWPFKEVVERKCPKNCLEGRETHKILVSLKSNGNGASKRENWSIISITTKRTNKTKATWR